MRGWVGFQIAVLMVAAIPGALASGTDGPECVGGNAACVEVYESQEGSADCSTWGTYGLGSTGIAAWTSADAGNAFIDVYGYHFCERGSYGHWDISNIGADAWSDAFTIWFYWDNYQYRHYGYSTNQNTVYADVDLHRTELSPIDGEVEAEWWGRDGHVGPGACSFYVQADFYQPDVRERVEAPACPVAPPSPPPVPWGNLLP